MTVQMEYISNITEISTGKWSALNCDVNVQLQENNIQSAESIVLQYLHTDSTENVIES